MKIEFTELGRHEGWLRLSAIVKAGDKHIQLERKLTSELIKNWRESYEDALQGLFKQIPEELSQSVIELITSRLSEALGQSFGSSQKVREELRKYITRAYESGKSEFAVKHDLSLPDIRAIDVLTKHNCYWLGEHYDKHIREGIAKLTQQAISDGLGRKELAKELREALGGKVGGYKYWDVVSSAALVRSRSFGCISGMVEAGITEYEILAMGDERMCPICGELNGKTFSVAETQKVIDRTLGISDPDKFKEAMPWHTASPAGVSKDKLIADGMSIPPFHGRCRCTLIMAGETSITPEQPIEMIRGVSKDEIDRQRGFRKHSGAGEITEQDIQSDYKRVGIDIDIDEAKKVLGAVRDFSGSYYTDMRKAFMKSSKGESLSSYEQEMLDKFNLCGEYTKIAPVYQSDNTGQEIYRGLRNNGSDYAKMLLGLQPGDTFDLQMPSSFSSTMARSEGFAGNGGIMLHVASDDIRNAPSIRGISHFPSEDEILVNDHLWEVVKVNDERSKSQGFFHITLRRKE